MADSENGNGVSKLTKYFKLIAAVVTTIGILAAAFVTFQSNFATAEDLNKLRIETVQTFDKLRQSMDQSDLRRQLTFLTERLYMLKDLKRRYPNDREIIEEYNDINNKVKKLKEKLGII
jgi:DNA repair ATPase RecN